MNQDGPPIDHDNHSAEDRQLGRRRLRAAIFKGLTMAAVLLAGTFLVIFLVDLLVKGLPALRQAEIQTEITLTPETARKVEQAFPEDVRDLISRAAKRDLAREMLAAEIRIRVASVDVAEQGPAAALRPITITAEDMPPWMRGDFEAVTIPVAQIESLVAPEGLQRIREHLAVPEEPAIDATGDQAERVTDIWVRGADPLQSFMLDSTGLSGELEETARLLDKAKIVKSKFDVKRFGPEGTTETRWIVADGEVDQYVKGYEYTRPSHYDDPAHAPLTMDMTERIDRLVDEGRIALNFNHYFFFNGDSKIPEVAGMWAAIVGSVYVLGFVFCICLPIGVATSIYLEEFAPDNWLTRTIEVNINNLAAVPSILFGVLGLAAFINFFGMPRSSVLVGAATLALMTLPVIIITSRAALRAVPNSIRKAGVAMGATRWQVVLHHVLPASVSGIMTGSIIGIAQAMGETAPLIIIGLVSFVPEAPALPGDSTTVMPAQIFSWWSMSLRPFQERAALAILVLLTVLFMLNGLAVWIRARSESKW